MLAFGVACIAVYALNAWAASDDKARYSDAAGVSSLLCLSYGLSNVLVELYGFPEAILAFPVVDAVLTFMVWRAWVRNRSNWKVAVMALLFGQLATHAVAIGTWKFSGLTFSGIYNYALIINVTFAAQLAVVSSAGIGHAVVRLGGVLSRLRRDHPMPGVR